MIMSQGDAVILSIHNTLVSNYNLTAYAVKTLELKKKGHLIFPTLKQSKQEVISFFFLRKTLFFHH